MFIADESSTVKTSLCEDSVYVYICIRWTFCDVVQEQHPMHTALFRILAGRADGKLLALQIPSYIHMTSTHQVRPKVKGYTY